MSIPKKLKKTTILESIVEFRYKNKIEIEEVFFIVRSILEENGFTYEKQQIMDLPVAIRENDPKLKYAPNYSFKKDSNIVHISPYMISFNIKGFYSSWTNFLNFIISLFSELNNLTSKWDLERTSMRYIDFFENTNIFDNINISINVPSNLCADNDIEEKSKNFISEFKCSEDISIRMQIVNNLEIKSIESIKKGSIIDMDVFSINLEKPYKDTLEELHNITKNSFFNILTKEFIETLDPEYEE